MADSKRPTASDIIKEVAESVSFKNDPAWELTRKTGISYAEAVARLEAERLASEGPKESAETIKKVVNQGENNN